MIMRNRCFFILFICYILICSCKLDCGGYVYYDNEPVAEGYVLPERLYCGQVRLQDGLATFYLTYDSLDVSVKYYHKGDEAYNRLSVKHRDSFEGWTNKYYFSTFSICYAMDFSSIDIICNREYDANHPAGSSLADIVNYEAISIYPWIRSGYQTEKKVYWISKPLSLVEPDDMTMLFVLNFKLSLLIPPFENGDYSFHITLKTDDGLTYEIDQDVTF